MFAKRDYGDPASSKSGTNSGAGGGRVKKRIFPKSSDTSLQTSTAGVGFTFTPHHLKTSEGDSGLSSSSEELRGSLKNTNAICGERMPPELCRQKRIEAAKANTTLYVGSLYEEQGSSKTRHIFLGGTRIASVTNGKISYVHTNHLGSTNVVTDDTGAIKELIEYEPWGTFAVHEKYGDDESTAWYYFTGKPLDDETGLYYYGARYYNPVIGRFITPDTIVPYASDPQSLNRYSYARNNPINIVDPTGHKWSWGNFWKAIGIAIVGITLTIFSGGTLAPLIGTYWAGIATGAIAGATIGGSFAAATGGNIGMGILAGAVGGGVFAGLAPGLSAFSDGIFRGITLGGAAGPLGQGAAMASNFTAGFLGGAASGAAVAGVNGTDVGQGALIGGAAAGAFSLIRDTGKYLRAKMIAQSRLDSHNSSGVSAGLDGDGSKVGGSRWDNAPGAKNAPSALGGLQGGQGKIFGINYPPGGIVDHVVESWAPPHDYLNSWAYNADGTLRQLTNFEQFVGGITNPLNIAIATPVAVPLMLGPTGASSPSIIYGYEHRRSEFK